MAKEEKEKEMQSKYLQLQVLDNQIKQVQQQIQKLDAQLTELETINLSLGDLKDIKEGTEILVPVATGIFFKANIKDTKNLLVNVGSNVSVKKTADDAIGMLNEQVKEIATYKEQITGQLDVLIDKATAIQKEFLKLSGQNV